VHDVHRSVVPGVVDICLVCCLPGIAWKGTNPGYVLTSGKDGCLCLHEFSSADEPLNKVSPVAVSIGPTGRVAHAFNNKLVTGQCAQHHVLVSP